MSLALLLLILLGLLRAREDTFRSVLGSEGSES